jgi:hypothetical protein
MPDQRRNPTRRDRLVAQSLRHLIHQAANVWTEGTFPPYIDRKKDPDPIVGRVVLPGRA